MADIEQDVRKDVQFQTAVDFDHRDPKAGVIVVIAFTTVIILAALCIGVYWFYTVSYEQVEFTQYTGVASKELIAIHEREDEQLHKYGYIDKQRGIVRLSVERAMELVELEAKHGQFSWNTKTYPAQPELPGGAAGMRWKADGTGAAASIAAPEIITKGSPAAHDASVAKK
jgi:hypothetical protein